MQRLMPALLPLSLLFLSGCAKAPQNKEAIRQGVVEYLNQNQKQIGLDLSIMDVEVGAVTFRDNEAKATVAFKPKGSPEAAMQISYTLAAKGNKWVVQKKGEGAGAGHADGAQDMPGMPPSGAAPAQPSAPAGGELPAGHPPVSSPPQSGAGK